MSLSFETIYAITCEQSHTIEALCDWWPLWIFSPEAFRGLVRQLHPFRALCDAIESFLKPILLPLTFSTILFVLNYFCSIPSIYGSRKPEALCFSFFSPIHI